MKFEDHEIPDERFSLRPGALKNGYVLFDNEGVPWVITELARARHEGTRHEIPVRQLVYRPGRPGTDEEGCLVSGGPIMMHLLGDGLVKIYALPDLLEVIQRTPERHRLSR